MTAPVSLHEVTKKYGRHMALDGVTLSVYRGEIVGVIGPNGAGKTSLLRILVGLLRPTGGTVRRQDGLRPGDVRYFGGERTLPPQIPARRWASLWMPGHEAAPSRRLAVLSRGTRQRLGLDVALRSPTPAVLALDEPWEGLDPMASRWLSGSLIHHRQHDAAIIISSHRLHDLADVCTRCVFLADGRLNPDQMVCGNGPADAALAAPLFEAFDRLGRPQ